MGEGKSGSTATGANDSRTGGASHSGDDLTLRISRELEEIGLTESAPWISSIVLYGTGGLTVLTVAAISPGTVSRFVQGLGVLGLLMAAFAVWGLKQNVAYGWATPVRVFTGISIVFAGGMSNGAIATSLGMILIFPPISAAFLYAARRSIPYMIVGTTALVVMLVAGHDGPWYLVHAVVSGTVMLTLVSAVILSRARLRMLINHHHERAITDPLTGLANTRHLNERIAGEIDQTVATGNAFALFAIDLDNFKRVNDEFNHRTGDDVLVAVAAAIQGEIGPDGLVARRGGDEFSVLIPAAALHDPDGLAQRIRTAIVAARRRICPSITPSGSVGYVLSIHGDTVDTVIERADQELHSRKLAFHVGEAAPGRGRSDGAVVDIASMRATADISVQERPAANGGILRSIGQRSFIVLCASLELAVLIPLVTVIGSTGTLSFVEALLIGSALFLLAGLLWTADRLRLGPWSFHAAYFVLGTLVATTVWIAGPAGSALLDLFVLVALMSFFVFTPRVAAIWLVAIFAAMIAITVEGQFAHAGARLGTLIASSVVLATMFAKIRKLTVKFMERHVEMSQIDSLTGLANRRLLQSRLTEQLAIADEAGEPVVMIAIDLNDFKSVNDRHSHSLGDRLLCDVAEAIRSTTRPEDLVARRGGDEFYIVCASACPEAAEAVGHRIGEAIVEARLALCPDINPTATVVTIASEPGDDAAALMYRADVALHTGRIHSHETRQREFHNAS